MSKLKIKRWCNADTFKRVYEVNEEPSLTVPDQSYTIPQIFQKFAQGVHLDIAHEPYYSDSRDLDLPDNLIISDLTDLEEVANVQVLRETKLLQKESADRAARGAGAHQKPQSDDGAKSGSDQAGATAGTN